jgi:hypothetical protein
MAALSKFNGVTGEAEIYSAYDGSILFKGMIQVGTGDFELFQRLESAIRKAENISERHGINSMSARMARVLSEVS